jgi:hypothetical protein
MSYLRTLTPAENLLLRDGYGANMRQMVKGTLLDLLFREALAFHMTMEQPNRRERVRRYKYIMPGNRYSTHRSLAHEEIFLGPYRASTSGRYQLRSLVAIAFERARGTWRYRLTVSTSPRLAAHYVAWLRRSFGVLMLNSTGRVARRALLAEIEERETVILAALGEDAPAAARMINDLGGNVLLLGRLPATAFEDLSDELFEDRRNRSSGTSGCGGAGCGGWEHSSLNEGFDGAAEAAGCGGGGCSGGGDGGGCSGCGGCGGD